MAAPRVARVAPYLVLAAAFAHNLCYGWLAWGDPVVDAGRELEAARQIAAGRWLYADVHWFYGPLAPYVNGALYTLFGVRAGVLMVAGAASAAAMALVLHRLALRLGGRLAATVTATAFLYLCGFGHAYFNSTYNWVLPYTYAATYGMLAATTSLFLLVRHVQEGRMRDLQLSLVCLALAALAKPETLAPAAAAHLVFAVAGRPRLGAHVITALAVAGVFGVFWLRLGSRLFDDYRLIFLDSVRSPIIGQIAGLAQWDQTAAAVGRSAGMLAQATALAAAAAFLGRRPGLSPWGRWAIALLAGAAAALACWRVEIYDQLRVLPLVLAALALYWAVRWWRAPAQREVALPELLVAVFAIACLARTPLAAGAFHYGFYLLPVPLLVLVVTWFRLLPAWLPGRPLVPVAATGVGLFAAMIASHYAVSRTLYARHTTLVETPRGRMYLLDDLQGFPIGPAHAETVRFLATYPPETTVMVIPMGVGLTFLAGLTSVCGMLSFVPPEVAGPLEDRLLACLETAPPDLVVGVSVNLSEYGVRAFGDGYASRVAAWLQGHYEPLARFGPGGYVFVLRHRYTPRP